MDKRANFKSLKVKQYFCNVQSIYCFPG